MRVSDQGGGDPELVEKLLHPGSLPDLDEERGRGFFLLTQMVEVIRVEKSADGRGLTLIAAQHYGERG
jgi:anti-sigma regulatory factor (Ser/Thr protein kinase)